MRKYFLLFRYCLFVVFFQVFAFSVSGQDCDFNIGLDIKGLTCQRDGKVTVSLSGKNITDGIITNINYRLVDNSTGQIADAIVSNNEFSSLPQGSYKLYVLGHCLATGEGAIDPVPLKDTVFTVPVAQEWIAPNMTLKTDYNNYNQTRKSLECLATGAIQISSITGGKAPYKITIEGDKGYKNEVTTSSSSYLLSNLAGDHYTITLTDACDYSRQTTFTLATLTSNMAAGTYLYLYVYPPAINISCNSVVFSKSVSVSDVSAQHYVQNWHLYYEYAFALPGDDRDTLTWTKCPNGSSITYTSPSYTLAEMRADPINKLPTVLFRMQDRSCPGISEQRSGFRPDPPFSSAYVTRRCDNYDYRWTIYNDFDGVICFPYTGELFKVVGTDTIQVGDSKTYNSRSADTRTLEYNTYYIYRATDSQGYYLERGINTSNEGMSISFSRQNSNTTCYDSIAPYMSYSTGSTLAGATIKFDPAKSTPGYPPLPAGRDSVTLSKLHTGYYYPWSKDSTNSYIADYKVFPSGGVLYFNVTDSCGRTRELYITVPQRYSHEAAPTYSTTWTCDGLRVTFNNLNSILKTENYSGSSSYTSSYVQVIKTPNGIIPSQLNYSNGSSYCSNNTSFLAPISGKYTIAVSPNTSFPTTYSCVRTYEIELVHEPLKLDPEVSTAYRCPGSSVGVGYIVAKGMNGSGNYRYELYASDSTTRLDNPSVPNTTGVFDSWNAYASDKYIVKVIDEVCNAFFPQEVQVFDLTNAVLFDAAGKTSFCEGESFSLYSKPLGLTDYRWYFKPVGGSETQISTSRHLEVTNPTPGHTGTYKIEVRIPGCSNIWVSYEKFINIAPRELWWNEHAVDNNWNNGVNWLKADGNIANAVPVECTKVHIAGVADKYPILDIAHSPRDPGLPVCDTIIYHFGSETAFPHYLKYRKAFIQYNFGYYNGYYDGQPWFNSDDDYPSHDWDSFLFPLIDRARWYSLSAPLKNIVAGDFGLSGYPKLWQRVYNRINPDTGSPTYGDFSTEVRTNAMPTSSTYNSIVLWASDYNSAYTGMDDHKNLEGLKGVIELPYINSASVAPYRPLHQYGAITGSDTLSIFQRFDDKTLLPVLEYDTIARGEKSHRFIFENYKDELEYITYNGSHIAVYRQTINQTGRTMIGNPFMAQLDFDKFYEFNQSIIKDYYEIYDGLTSSFKLYRYQGGSGTDPELSKAIAPLQGFVVDILDPAPVTLIYPMANTDADDIAVFAYDKNYGNDLNNKPRVQKAENPEEGKLRITAVTRPRALYGQPSKARPLNDSIRISASILFNRPELQSISKVVFPEDLNYKVELFLKDKDGNFNVEQVENGCAEQISLGYQSTYSGTVRLCFEKEGILNDPESQVWIKDELTGKEVELVGAKSYYTFNNYSVISGDTIGLNPDRFTLRFRLPPSSLPESGDKIRIYTDHHQVLYVESSETINTVRVIDLKGVRVSESKDVNSTYYSQHLDSPAGSYLVEVKLENGKIESRKIILK